MSDKDVTRNVRASGVEGIPTATEKHFHSISEKGNLPYGKGSGGHGAEREELLAKFKERERRQEAEEPAEHESPSESDQQPEPDAEEPQ